MLSSIRSIFLIPRSGDGCHAVPRVVPNDPDDDQVLACALTAQADLIVSGDRKHLLPLGSYQGIRIVEPATALQLIGSG